MSSTTGVLNRETGVVVGTEVGEMVIASDDMSLGRGTGTEEDMLVE